MTPLQALRRVERENGRMRSLLADMLTDGETVMLDNHWWGSWPRHRRLCGMLARYVRTETAYWQDLLFFKRARKALGLPWWGGLDYEDGLQPGKGRA